MVDPRELQPSDRVSIALEDHSDVSARVSDVEVEDIGLTETFAVTLVSDSEGAYSLVGTAQNETANLSYQRGPFETTIEWDDLSLE